MDMEIKSKREMIDFRKKYKLRQSWHEPDEQGITATIIGTKLDNAFGVEIREKAIEHGYQEIIVVLKKDSEIVGKINLASLLAFASTE